MRFLLKSHDWPGDPVDSVLNAPIWVGLGLRALRDAPWWVWLAVLGMFLFLFGLYQLNKKLGGFRW